MSESYSISALAREFDVTTRAIRFYEDKQLLNPVREGNVRVYSRADRTRLKLILRGKRLGFQLDDIKRLLDLFDVPAGEGEYLQLKTMLSMLHETRGKLQAKREDLMESLAEIEEMETRCLEQLTVISAAGNKSVGARPATDSQSDADLSGNERTE